MSPAAAAMVSTLSTAPWSGVNASGLPVRRLTRIIDGRRVILTEDLDGALVWSVTDLAGDITTEAP